MQDCRYSLILKSSGTLLANAQRLVAFNRPASRDYRSVETYCHNTKPLIQSEGEFIRRKEDFITLRPGRENAWLDAVVERTLKKWHCPLVRVG